MAPAGVRRKLPTREQLPDPVRSQNGISWVGCSSGGVCGVVVRTNRGRFSSLCQTARPRDGGLLRAA